MGISHSFPAQVAAEEASLEAKHLAADGRPSVVAVKILKKDVAVIQREVRGRTRVIQRRFNVSVPRARVPETASTRRERSEE